MKTPNDIINIVRKLLLGNKIKKCNREYYELYCEKLDGLCMVALKYKNNDYLINHRFYFNCMRRNIVCFLTEKETKYYIPKNY